MLRHEDIWRAVDRLAGKYGLSASGLARRGGLDPTTFNKSKRITKEGKRRWPSTESISKILEATGASFPEFCALVDEDGSGVAQRIPVIGYAEASSEGFFDDSGYPTGGGWGVALFPQVGDPHAFVLKISDDSMAPVYRDGDMIIVSPAADVRRGDRVVIKNDGGAVMVRQLISQSALRVELESVNPGHPAHELDTAHMLWMARIIWTSQ